MEQMVQQHVSTVRVLRAETDELTQSLEESHQGREKMRGELKKASTYIGKIEGRLLDANQTSLDLLKQVRQLELETATLKSYIIDLKARVAVYVPIKDDPIDLKVAEFINNYPDRNKLKIMFMRDSAGVYDFGSKKINVRVEKNKIQIRVGGGYLSIDEFLDQFTPVELEKLERRDPLKRFSHKVALQKTLVGKEIDGSKSPAKCI